jgi:hypothetical protein
MKKMCSTVQMYLEDIYHIPIGSVNPSTKGQLFNKIKMSTHIPLLTYYGQHNE